MSAARATSDPPPTPRASGERAAFVASLPLLLVSVALFVGSVVVFRLDPSAGPGGFPLWGLLLTLGFIAAIGTTVSWFYAAGPTAPPATAPDAPAPAVPEDLGRPAPDVRRGSAPSPVAESWDESVLPVRPSPSPVRPRALAPDPGPDDVEKALDEIEAIEEELESRPRVTPRPAGAPARS